MKVASTTPGASSSIRFKFHALFFQPAYLCCFFHSARVQVPCAMIIAWARTATPCRREAGHLVSQKEVTDDVTTQR